MQRNQMIKAVQSVFTPRTNTSRELLKTVVTADLSQYLLQYGHYSGHPQ